MLEEIQIVGGAIILWLPDSDYFLFKGIGMDRLAVLLFVRVYA